MRDGEGRLVLAEWFWNVGNRSRRRREISFSFSNLLALGKFSATSRCLWGLALNGLGISSLGRGRKH